MNIVPWRDSNDDVSTRQHEGGGVEEDQEQETNGKTVITKKQSLISPSSSSSWMKSKDPRIVRVSRAFGGKDRHSKVCTLRGLRDRRVRLSVPTAIQLYDLQERLGVDQPSKAVDWLLEVAKEEIDELPPLPVSPENFSIFNNHQSFLNLGQRSSQDPSQIGFKSCLEDHQSTTTATTATSREANNNKEKGETDVVFANNHHIGSYIGTYNHQNMEHHLQLHHQHSSFQADYHQPHHQNQHQHQLHSLVPYPSQILVCPMTTTTSTTTTIQSLFPSSSTTTGSGAMETIDPRQMVNHFQMPLMGTNSSSSSSQNMSSLYSLLHGTSNSNRANSGGNVSRLLGSEHCTSRGSGHRM